MVMLLLFISPHIYPFSLTFRAEQATCYSLSGATDGARSFGFHLHLASARYPLLHIRSFKQPPSGCDDDFTVRCSVLNSILRQEAAIERVQVQLFGPGYGVMFRYVIQW